MSDDWKIGDLALCIKLTPWKGVKSGKDREGPKPGAVLTVRDLSVSDAGLHCLHFDGFLTPSGKKRGFASVRFRKIRPLTDEERNSFAADLGLPHLVEA